MARAWTVNMYEDDPHLHSLLDLMPRKESLCVSRLLKSYITTDTCSTARKVQCLLSTQIIEIAKERGITSTNDLVFIMVCVTIMYKTSGERCWQKE